MLPCQGKIPWVSLDPAIEALKGWSRVIKDDIKDPIVSNLLTILKPNKQIRPCYDCRLINYFTAKGKCFHRSLTQTLRDIDLNIKFFSTLDLSAAYFCIKLHPNSGRFFCFRDENNKLCNFERIPQGYVDSDQHLFAVRERVFPPRLDARGSSCKLSGRFDYLFRRVNRRSRGPIDWSPRKAQEMGPEIKPQKSEAF